MFLFLFFRTKQLTQTHTPRRSQTDIDCGLIRMRMLFLIILIQTCVYESDGKPIPLPSPDPYDPFKDNEFVLLAKAVSRTFNLCHCWVCGGPLGLSSWPWTSAPLTPDQIVSNYRETADDTWGDSGTWPIQYPTVGQYCLNRTQRGGIYVGESKCQWTLTRKLVDKDRRVYIWMWLNETGRTQGFKGYWSNKNETLSVPQTNYKQICEWKNNSGAWYCTGRTSNCPTMFFSPLGDDNTTYFQLPKGAAGPFAHGVKAKKGHCWICRHTAYKHLPAGWSGISNIGIIRPLFFLLPERGGARLGIKLYDNLGDRSIARKT